METIEEKIDEWSGFLSKGNIAKTAPLSRSFPIGNGRISFAATGSGLELMDDVSDVNPTAVCGCSRQRWESVSCRLLCAAFWPRRNIHRLHSVRWRWHHRLMRCLTRCHLSPCSKAALPSVAGSALVKWLRRQSRLGKRLLLKCHANISSFVLRTAHAAVVYPNSSIYWKPR